MPTCETRYWQPDMGAEADSALTCQWMGLPAARGMVAVATDVVCKMTFSPMLKADVIPYRSKTRNTPNPSTADCMRTNLLICNMSLSAAHIRL